MQTSTIKEHMRMQRVDRAGEHVGAESPRKRYNSYLTRLKDRVDAGGLKPIHMHVFEGLEEGAGPRVRLKQQKRAAQGSGRVRLNAKCLKASRISERCPSSAIPPAGTEHRQSGALGARHPYAPSVCLSMRERETAFPKRMQKLASSLVGREKLRPSKLPAEGTHVLSGGTGALGVARASEWPSPFSVLTFKVVFLASRFCFFLPFSPAHSDKCPIFVSRGDSSVPCRGRGQVPLPFVAGGAPTGRGGGRSSDGELRPSSD